MIYSRKIALKKLIRTRQDASRRTGGYLLPQVKFDHCINLVDLYTFQVNKNPFLLLPEGYCFVIVNDVAFGTCLPVSGIKIKGWSYYDF